ncbi:MAG: exo-alpha-sialidase [Bacteroidales bacterium]|nr:exo-alpha-sialidase [Bacteroidales bacterium]
MVKAGHETDVSTLSSVWRLITQLAVLPVLLTALSCSRGTELPSVREGLLDLSDTLTLGLTRLAGTERICVFRSDGEGYVNNVLLSKFKGTYYCMWQSSLRDEDSPDTHVVFAVSPDGRSWSEPRLMAAPTDSCFVSPGGWLQRGDSLAAVLNYVDAADRSRGGTAWVCVTGDGAIWTSPCPLLMADGTAMDGILEQDPQLLPGGRTVGAAHFRPGLQVQPIYTDDPSGLRGWRAAGFPAGDGKPLEPSQFRRPDGVLVMIFRDQASSFAKLASVSSDNGESWSPTVLTGIPDSRSKQCGGNLPDGRSFMVWNPTGGKSRRALVLALSDDGVCFDRAWILAGPSDLTPRRHAGRYKTLGYNYPKAFVEDDALWIALSENKEDAVLFRVPLNTP